MAFSKQEHWNRFPFPSPGDLPSPRIKPASPISPALVGRFLPPKHLEAQAYFLTIQMHHGPQEAQMIDSGDKLKEQKNCSSRPRPAPLCGRLFIYTTEIP